MFKKLTVIMLLLIPIYLAGSLLFPKYLPNNGLLNPISLGIDLKGGNRIILGIDDKDITPLLHTKMIEFMKSETDVEVVSKDADSVVFRFKGEKKPLSEKAITDFKNNYHYLTLLETGDGYVISDLTKMHKQELANVIKRNIDVINARLNSLGAADISVYKQGDNKIVVELPLGTDLAYTKKVLTSTSKVGLYLVSNEADATIVPFDDNGQMTAVPRQDLPFITGGDINEATAVIDMQTSLPTVSVRLNAAGGKSMSEVSTANIGKPIVTTIKETVLVDGVRKEVERVASVATIQMPLDRMFQISGMDSMEACQELAVVLQSGSLNAPMSIISEQTVDARLGGSNIEAGLKAFSVGMILLFAYIVYLYRVNGVIACLTLIVNASLIIIGLSSVGASFTLTGIAGVVLTMGIAVDANIIVFERAKELGGNIKQAFLDSYATIIDANITTMIAAIILVNVGSIALKGFALTLAVGILTTVISSYFINKAVLLHLMGHDKRENI